MAYRESLLTDKLRCFLGTRAQLVDVPLFLQNSKSVNAASSPATDWSSYNNPSAVEKAAIDRDAYCCRMCGFLSKQFQRALALTGDRRDIDQMVTVCIFCYQCLRLDLVAAMESGVLIWAPEVSQAELHHIAREIYAARVVGGEAAETATECLAAIFARREVSKQQIGTDDPAALSARIEMAGGQTSPDDGLSSVRLFPLDRLLVRKGDRKINLFPPILSYWVSSEGPYANVASDSLSWIAYGRAAFTSELQTPTQAQPTGQDRKESEQAIPKIENEGKLFACRRNTSDRFRFDILQLNTEKNEYEHIGEYQVIDVTEAPEITQWHVENLIHIMNGDNHLIHDLRHLTNNRIEWEVLEEEGDQAIIVLTSFDGNVATKNAVLKISKSIFWGL